MPKLKKVKTTTFAPILASVPLEQDPIFSTNDKMNKIKNLINQKISQLHENVFWNEMDIVHKKIDEKAEEVKEDLISLLNEFWQDYGTFEKETKTFAFSIQNEIEIETKRRAGDRSELIVLLKA